MILKMLACVAEARSLEYLDLSVPEFHLKGAISSFTTLGFNFVYSKDDSFVPDVQLFELFSRAPEQLLYMTFVRSPSFFEKVSRYILGELKENWQMETARLYIKLLKIYKNFMNECLSPVISCQIYVYWIPGMPFFYSEPDQFAFHEIQMMYPAQELRSLLYKNNCTDSNLVAEFVHTVCISLKLREYVFLESDIQETIYLLHHLRKADFNMSVWMRECSLTGAFQRTIRERPKHMLVFLNYGYKIIFKSSVHFNYTEQSTFNYNEHIRFPAELLPMELIVPPMMGNQRINRHRRSNPKQERREALILEICNIFQKWDTGICTHILDIYLESLHFTWRSIPDPFITYEELRSMCPIVMTEPKAEVVKKICDNFRKCCIFQPESDDVLQPRSLSHYSRCVIRDVLCHNSQLPDGISLLKLPDHLRSYLRLEF